MSRTKDGIVLASCHNSPINFCGDDIEECCPRYEIRPRNDQRGVDLISDALPFGRLWYDTPDNAIGYAIQSSHSHDAVIRVYDAAGKT